ncbi:MAG: hypothetical protein JXQ99_28820 [Hyphomicrobiaceae bacterium]
MAIVAVVVLGCASANASSLRGFSELPAVQSTAVAPAEAAFVKVKSCSKIDALRPSPRECRHTVGAGIALRRPRSYTDGVAVVASALRMVPLFGGYGGLKPQIGGTRLPRLPGSVRAPFWAVFAMAPQLRN